LQETTHVTFDKYKSTQPDVVMQGSRSIVEWMNDPKRAIYLKLFCQEYGQVCVKPLLSAPERLVLYTAF
jgi:hypothetical protein